MSRSISVLFICAFVVVSASAFMWKTVSPSGAEPREAGTQQKADDKAKQDITDSEKLGRLKGERVTILGTKPVSCPTQEKAEIFFLRSYEKSEKRLPAGKYVGQTGVIVEAAMKNSVLPEIVIQLDKTGEKVVCQGDKGLGFQSELELAKEMVGRSLWSRGPQTLTPDHQLCQDLMARSESRVPLRNLQKATITRVEFGHHLQPIYLLLKTEDGKEGWLTGWDGYDYFDERFHITPGRGVGTYHYSHRFHTEDPRKLHPDWKDSVWKLIENGEMTIGMTEEMAKLACGRGIKPVGSLAPPPSDETSSIFECGCDKVLVEKGKLTKYIEPEPKLVQASNGFEIALLSIENKGERWQDDLNRMVYGGKKNREIIVARLSVKRTGEQKKFEVNRPELFAADGTKGESIILSLTLEFGESCRRNEANLPFAVAKGAKLKTLRIADVTFDLEKLEAK